MTRTGRQGPGHTLDAVPANERTSLGNLLDSLDRFYDRHCGPADVDALLTATASAVKDPSWIWSIEQASTALQDLARLRLPPELQYRKALEATNDLRIRLANYQE